VRRCIVPQQVQVVDAVGAAGHPGHDRDHFRRRVDAVGRAQRHVLADQPPKAAPLGQP
jgi:hypothetical protein